MPLKNAENPKHILYIFHVEMKNVYILIKQTVINHRGRITCGVTADGFRVDRVCYHFSARLAACFIWMLKTFVKFLQPSPFPPKIKLNQPRPKPFILFPNPELVLVHVSDVLVDNTGFCSPFIVRY